jgi:hypothetical protein
MIITRCPPYLFKKIKADDAESTNIDSSHQRCFESWCLMCWTSKIYFPIIFLTWNHLRNTLRTLI